MRVMRVCVGGGGGVRWSVEGTNHPSLGLPGGRGLGMCMICECGACVWVPMSYH